MSRPSISVLCGLALALGACAAAAGEGRPAADDAARRFDYYYLDPFRPRFVRRAGPAGAVYESRPSFGRVAQSFAAQKAPGEKRVFFIGGSVVQLYDAPDYPTLRQALSAVLPGQRIAAVNCGSSGYDSPRDSLVLSEVLQYGPDLVVLVSGVNENAQSLPPRWLARLCGGLSGLPLADSVCRKAVFASTRAKGGEDTVERFVTVVRSMAGMARSRGVPLALCTMPVNLRDMPPKGVMPLSDPRFFSAWLAWERGRLRPARDGFQAYLKTEPESAFGHYCLARCLDRLGDLQAAAEHYRQAWNSAGPPVPAFNDALRRVAREEGLPLVDLERAFAAAAPQGLVGRELMEDDMHWDKPLDRLASLAIAKGLWARSREPGRSVLAPSGEWTRDWPAGEEASALAALRKLRPDRKKSWMVFRYRAWEPETLAGQVFSEREIALLETMRSANPALLENVAGLKAWLKGELTRNVWEQAAAARLDEWWPVFLAHVGELYRRRGEPGRAAGFFAEALSLRPDMDKVRLYAALAFQAAGAKGRAEAELARISDLDRDGETRLRLRAHGLAPALPQAQRTGAVALRRPDADLRRLLDEGYRLVGTPAQTSPFAFTDEQRAALELRLLETFRGEGQPGLAKLTADWASGGVAQPGQAMLRCVALGKFNLFSEARRYCTTVIEARPRELEIRLGARCARAEAEAGLGAREAARADWRQALSEAPSGWARREEIRRRLRQTGP